MDTVVDFLRWGAFAAGGLTLVAVGALYVYQGRLLYFPDMPPGARHEFIDPGRFGLSAIDVWVTTSDNVKLHSWLFRAPLKHKEQPTLIYFHGNAGNISHRLPNIKDLVGSLNFNVLIVSYRGYGYSEGAPSEPGLKIDADAVLKYVHANATDLELDSGKVFGFGRSLGGAVACHMAFTSPQLLRGIILENTFTSIADMIDVVIPIFRPFKPLLKNKWDNKKIIDKINVPILFISGDSDELVPPHMMGALHTASTADSSATGKARNSNHQFHSVHGGGHNDTWMTTSSYYSDLRAWVHSILGEETTGN